MFSAKELNLEETELRERVRNLTGTQRVRYTELEQQLLKDPQTYLRLNWIFPTGAHHFYLRRWVRGTLNLVFSLTAVYLLLNRNAAWYGLAFILAELIIEIPQLLNARHLVHAYNNRAMHRCLRRATRIPAANPSSTDAGQPR